MIADYSILFYRFYYQLIKKSARISATYIGSAINEKLSALNFELLYHSDVNWEINYGKIILAADLGTSFRKKIFPDYKGNRLKKDIKLKKLYFNTLKNLSEIHNYEVFMYYGLEADDICYLYSIKKDNSIVISEDSDMHQVTLYNNTKLYLPFKKMFYSGEPGLSLTKKILLGDKSDNIPRCARPKIGPKKIEQVYYTDNINIDDLIGDHKQFELNTFLCDFSKVDYSQFKFNIL